MATTKHKSILASAVCTVAIASPATAGIEPGDTLTMTFLSAQPSRTVTSSLDGGATTKNVLGGVLNWSVAGQGTIQTFCAQLNESITIGSTYDYTVVDLDEAPEAPPGPGPMGPARASLIEDLYARNYSSVMTTTGSEQRNLAAAFAMVIWEITHQDSSASTASGILADLDLTAGNAQFFSGSSVNALAADMLDGLGGGTGAFLGFAVLGATNPDKQDVLIVVPGPMGLAAFAGLAAIRRRRRG